MKSWIARILAIGAIALIASACSPQDIKAYYQSIGVTITDAEATDQANAVNKFAAEQQQLHRFDYAMSDAALLRLRTCESGGNYAAENRSSSASGSG